MRYLSGLTLLFMMSGCSSITHELQPHRLWRWNYYEPPGRTDGALFSIDDPMTHLPSPSSSSASDKHNDKQVYADQSK